MSKITESTIAEAPQASAKIHPLFAAFVAEVPANQPLWLNGSEVLTAAQVLQELQSTSPTGVRYAQEMLHEMYVIIRMPLRTKSPAADTLDVSGHARDMFAPIFAALRPRDVVWKTMSGLTTAAKMIELVKSDHEDAIQFVQGRLYLARDLLADEARRQA